MEKKQAFSLGLLLSQGGEFAFVLFHQAQGALLIAPSAASLFSAFVTISMATTPFLLLLAQKLEFARPSREKAFHGPDQAPQGAALVIGYGCFGQTVAPLLRGHGCASPAEHTSELQSLMRRSSAVHLL